MPSFMPVGTLAGMADEFCLCDGSDGVAEPLLGAGLVFLGVEGEGAALVGSIDGPAGEDGGEGGDVGLGVAAVDAEGVELHHFPAVVLVEAAVAFLRVGVGGVDAVGDGVGADG